jgi:carbamoyltransferase
MVNITTIPDVATLAEIRTDNSSQRRIVIEENILSINPCIYGLNQHDPSAAIISNGKIKFAIEEERINCIKGSIGLFPVNAIKECLRYANLNEDKITGISVCYDPLLWKNRFNLEFKRIIGTSCDNDAEQIFNEILSSDLLNRYIFFKDVSNVKNLIIERSGLKNVKNICFFGHHLSHIASAYEVSTYKEATGVVVDGIGETSVTTIWKICDGKYEKILDIEYPNSLGYFYAIATAFLGFDPHSHEGKTMALAAYGKQNNEICMKMKEIIDTSNIIYDVSTFVEENATGFLMLDNDKAIKSIEKIMGFSARKNDEPILDVHKNFAWAAQNILEESVTKLVNYGIKETGISDVCVAGGVFLNCKMNMVVREKSHATNYFVQPLAGDMGLVIGSGLLMSKTKYKDDFCSLDFGPNYSDNEIKDVLVKYNISFNKSSDIANDVAKLIGLGKIVCWFQGRMEMGARALGNRSILADPTDPTMSDRVNNLVKHREPWRPFACSVLEEDCKDIFENFNLNKKYPFMIEAFKVKRNWMNKIPAVIHEADGTSRPQTVNRNDKPLYYDMINCFKTITGCPLVLNTSFNDKGQPIIMSPTLAVQFFMKIPVDVLAIGNFIAEKENN